jgi:hypothetical protein
MIYQIQSTGSNLLLPPEQFLGQIFLKLILFLSAFKKMEGKCISCTFSSIFLNADKKRISFEKNCSKNVPIVSVNYI